MCLLTPVKGEYSNARRLDAYHTNALVCKESKSPASLILQDKQVSIAGCPRPMADEQSWISLRLHSLQSRDTHARLWPDACISP